MYEKAVSYFRQLGRRPLDLYGLEGAIQRSSILTVLPIKGLDFVLMFVLLVIQNRSLSISRLAVLGVILSTYALAGTFVYGPIGMYLNVNFDNLLRRNRNNAVVALNLVASTACVVFAIVAVKLISGYATVIFSSTELLTTFLYILTRFLFMGQVSIGNLLLLQKQTAVVGLLVSTANVLFCYTFAVSLDGELSGWLTGLALSYLGGYVLLLAQQARVPILASQFAPRNNFVIGLGALYILAMFALPAFRSSQIDFPRIVAARVLSPAEAGAYFTTTQLLLASFAFVETIVAVYYGPILNYLSNVRLTEIGLRYFVTVSVMTYGYLLFAASLVTLILWPILKPMISTFAPHISAVPSFLVAQILLTDGARQVASLLLLSSLFMRRHKFVVVFVVTAISVLPVFSLFLNRMEISQFVNLIFVANMLYATATLSFFKAYQPLLKKLVKQMLYSILTLALVMTLILPFASERLLQVLALLAFILIAWFMVRERIGNARTLRYVFSQLSLKV